MYFEESQGDIHTNLFCKSIFRAQHHCPFSMMIYSFYHDGQRSYGFDDHSL